MNHDSGDSNIQEQAALYALGALGAGATRLLEDHLKDGCPGCRQAVSEYKQVMAFLGLTCETDSVPAYLRDIVLARIQRESQEPSPAVAEIQIEPPPTAWPTFELPIQSRKPTKVKKTARNKISERARLPWILAAATAIGAVLIFVAWQDSEREIFELSREIALLEGDRVILEERLEETSVQIQQLREITSALKNPATTLLRLRGQPVAPAAYADIVWVRNENRWIVTAELPPAPQDRQYQLWVITPATRVSAGLLWVDDQGYVFSQIPVPQGVESGATVAITLEPTGGSRQPSFPIHVQGRIE